MDRHFLIPATIAAALHAGLLFGIRPSHTAIDLVSCAKPDLPDSVIRVFELFPEPPSEATDTAVKQGSTEAAPPVLPEPTPVNTAADFVFKVPETPSPVNLVPDAKLPRGPIGIPSGLPEGLPNADSMLFGPGALDNSPRTRTQSPPTYPFEAKRNGQSGTVLVEFVVDEAGAVLSPRVVESTDSIFNEPAMRAILRWRFEPGRRDGRVVRFKMAVPMVFSMHAE